MCPERPARIILLNGTSSAGKSSIAKALQDQLARPFLHVRLDDFLAMMPTQLIGHPDGLRFRAGKEDGRPVTEIECGSNGERLFRGMRRAIAALAAAGNDLIVDEVLLFDAMADYRPLLAPFQLHLVGIVAPLAVLEAREIARGDRHVGLARWQYHRVHEGLRYDLEVDSSRATPAECAARIIDAFGL